MTEQRQLFAGANQRAYRRNWQEKGYLYHFDGPTYVRQRDGVRLSTQLDKVREWSFRWTLVEHGCRAGGPPTWRWFTLEECTRDTGYPMSSLPSISSKLRDLRKPKHGAFLLLARYRDRGLWEYLLIPPEIEHKIPSSMLRFDTGELRKHQ